MLEAIRRARESSDYDFRATANPDDPLAHLFPDWVDNYRLKRAIAQAIGPASILEIGVRFGYSALAFLSAAPRARYLGIDLDVMTHGGHPGALPWARQALAAYDAELLAADTQAMQRLPGGVWDLVHVDGQQDGDGTWRDLALAVGQARHILVDGYLWTPLNFRAVNEFLYSHREAIEDCLVIPGYAGELLIRVREGALQGDGFDDAFYGQGLPGADAFKRFDGRFAALPSHRALLQLAAAAGGRRALDLGCGRGEVSLGLAALGFEVDALDRSPGAHAHLARALAAAPDLSPRVRAVQADAAQARLAGRYDVVVAGDTLDAIAGGAIAERLAAWVGDDGILLGRAGRNPWTCRREWRRQRRAAAGAGLFVAPEPRAWMDRRRFASPHSPASLARLLRPQLPAIAFGDDPGREPADLARRPMQLRESPAFYFAAARDRTVLARLRDGLGGDIAAPGAGAQVALSCPAGPAQAAADTEVLYRVAIRNDGSARLTGCGPRPVSVCYHWLGDDGRTAVFEGVRTPLIRALAPGEACEHEALVRTPSAPGRYTLRLTLLQEHVRWFDEPGSRAVADVAVRIR